MHRIIILVLACLLCTPSAFAQFYKGKTLTFLINYGAGGNADTEARVYQRHFAAHIDGHPSIVIQNLPGAGGFAAMNSLGLGIGYKADGLTVGYFTTSAIAPIIDDPALKIKIYDFLMVGAARGWNIVYARKDLVDGGITKPEDITRAHHIYAGGYSRSSSHDTRMRLLLEILGLSYDTVTGFPGTIQINKAMIQNEVNFTGTSLPGYQTQVIPQIINTNIGIPLFYYPIIGADNKTEGNPLLEQQGIHKIDDIYTSIHGAPPSGDKWNALLLMSDLGTRMQRGLLMPKNTPDEALTALRKGFNELINDHDFIEDYKRTTGEEPDLVRAEDIDPLFDRMKNIDPKIKNILLDSIKE
jgi:tripartite-type tricarboxylate transporter receptor subunit TctC